MILPCKCENKGQDEIHGKGRRVHNPAGESGRGSRPKVWRGTVCLSEKPRTDEKGGR